MNPAPQWQKVIFRIRYLATHSDPSHARRRWQAALAFLRDHAGELRQWRADWAQHPGSAAIPQLRPRVCDFCVYGEPAPEVALWVAPANFAIRHAGCRTYFLNGCVAMGAYYGAVYVVLRLGRADKRSNLSKLPPEVFDLLWYRYVLGRL
jgi:hypothetical protein